jgi:hypothetical protein
MKRLRLNFDRTIDAGNCLTMLTIFISLIGLLVSSSKDRQLRIHEQAERVRTAASRILSKLDRLKAISEFQFEEVKPIFVQTKEAMARNFDVTAGRDLIWGKLHEMHVKLERLRLDENIETAYAELYGYDTSIRDLFQNSKREFMEVYNAAFTCLLEQSQEAVQAWQNKARSDYKTALLWNDLLARSAKCRQTHDQAMESRLMRIARVFHAVVRATDDELLERKPLKDFVPNLSISQSVLG